MFSKSYTSRDPNDLGEVDLAYINDKQAAALAKLFKTSPSLGVGKHKVRLLDSENTPQIYTLTLQNPIVYRGAFDPSVINGANQPILNSLLERASLSGMCKSGYQGIKSSGSKTIEIYDSRYTIIKRKKFSNTYYYDLIGSGFAGKGNFGSVRPIIGTIKPRFGDASDLYFSPSENKRVVKIIHEPLGHFSKHTIDNEIELMQAAGYFKVRNRISVLDGSSLVTIISMKRFPWVGLKRFIAMDDEKRIELSIDDRLQISIRMLRELKRQIHDNNIVHRDIKPDNIHINKDKITHWWEINYIDLGLSLKSHITPLTAVGTPLYIAPETLNSNPQSQESDIYALARTIAEIWHDNRIHISTPSTSNLDKFLRKRATEYVIDFDLFRGLDLSDDLKDSVESVIRGLSAYFLSDRFSIDEGIAAFEKIRIQRILADTEDSAKAEVAAAHAQALVLTRELDTYAKRPQNCSMSEFKASLLKKIEPVPDHPLALKVFLETISIKCLHGCDTKAKLSSRISNIISEYVNVKNIYIATISDLHLVNERNIDATRLHPLPEYDLCCEKFIDDVFKKQTLDLDLLASLTKSIKSKTKEVREGLNHYRQIVDEETFKKDNRISRSLSIAIR